MATKKITGLHDASIIVSTSGNTYTIAEGAKVIATGEMSNDPSGAIMEDLTAKPAPRNNVFNIDGQVIGFMAGIYTAGAKDEVHIGDTGKVSGLYGVMMRGDKVHFSNDGEVIGMQAYGVYSALSDGGEFRNNGSIIGIAGVAIQASDKVLLVNTADGEILGAQVGVMMVQGSGQTGRFVNHGSVISTIAEGGSFIGGDGNETVVNDGKMMGNVQLMDGNDSFDNRGGVVQGTIVGGAGDDTLITDKAGVKLYEIAETGIDTVKSTVSYVLSDNVERLFLLGNADIGGTGNNGDNTLRGNGGDNLLKGRAGSDDLFGGKGNDKLYGGLDADIFHFAKGGGKDTVADFDAMQSDKIDISDWTGLETIAQVKGHAHNQGDDVLISLGTDSLLIKDMHKADLVDGYFSF